MGGQHDAIHPRDRGRLQDADHKIVQDCIADDRIIVTSNARDFRALVKTEVLHPGLIIIPATVRDETMRLLDLALAYLLGLNAVRLEDAMVNHVLEIDIDGKVELYLLPKL